MTDTHEPEAWFHEAGSDQCPHGAEPDRTSDAWDVWADRHTGSPQDVYICLEAPAGEACGTCSAEDGEMVPWSACHERARTKEQPAPEQRAAHERITVQVAGLECLERECEEFFTDDGDEIPGKDTCSHFSEMDICAGCSEPPAWGEFVTVVAWADCKQLAPAP
ncbi:hypothetical protein ABZ438_07835 [Streptomyces sp. NPDC005786]|uniref:hypothetical protein n=1 Tax=Streptomyces sp. NPDC005786 TaxID=3154891 RepID=UPI0033F7C9C1